MVLRAHSRYGLYAHSYPFLRNHFKKRLANDGKLSEMIRNMGRVNQTVRNYPELNVLVTEVTIRLRKEEKTMKSAHASSKVAAKWIVFLILLMLPSLAWGQKNKGGGGGGGG